MSETLVHRAPQESRMKLPDLFRVAGVDIAEIELSDQETATAQEFVQLYTSKDGTIDTKTLAEYVWALRMQLADTIRSVEGKEARRQYVTEDTQARFAIALYRQLLVVEGIQKTITSEWGRHNQETTDLNSNYEDYKKKEQELADRTDTLNGLLADIFKHVGREPQMVQLAQRALLERQITQLQETLDKKRLKSPDIAARVEYDTIVLYARQLRTGGFIWTKSRKELLRSVLTGVLTSRPVAALMGETGSGKTAMARALSIEIASQEPERTVGGDEEKFKKLLVIPSFDREKSFFKYGALLRAITGKNSDLDEHPTRGGGVFFDDEFNTRPTSVQREILKFVAEIRPGRSFTVPGTDIVETALPGFLYLAGGNPPSERYDREETGIETKREFGANVINVEYLEQTPDNPELYQVMLAGLLDSVTGRLVAVTPDELKPIWKQNATTQKWSLSTDITEGGFVYRFANVWKELFNAFSHKDTVLTQQAKKSGGQETEYYLDSFILDAGVVMSWIDQYKNDLTARQHHIEAFFKDKLTHYLSQFDDEEQKTVKEYLKYFDIDLDKSAPPKPSATILTPKDIGHLNPNVPHEIEQKEGGTKPPDLLTVEIMDQNGRTIEYIRRAVGTWQPGTVLTRKDDAPSDYVHEQLSVLGSMKSDKQQIVCNIGNGTGILITYTNLQEYYTRPTPETGTPFSYDTEKAREYGMEEIKLPAYQKVQELFDNIIARDSRYVTIHNIGDPDPYRQLQTLTKQRLVFNKQNIQTYWNTHCAELPNIPDKSWSYFVRLIEGFTSKTIINGDKKNTIIKKYIPRFGNPTFLLVMDFPEFDWNNEQQKQQAFTHPSMRITQKFFNKLDPTAITHDEINAALWEDPDRRTQSLQAKAIIAELLGKKISDPEIDDYELRLIRQDEYARLAKIKNYGKKKIWTHMDGYRICGVKKLYDIVSGYYDRLYGDDGAARVDNYPQNVNYDCIVQRLVLSHK